MNEFEEFRIEEDDLTDVGAMKKMANKWNPSQSSIKGPNDPIDICLMHVLPNLFEELTNTEEIND